MVDAALAVVRLQPLHNGHKLLIESMLNAAKTALIGIGSANKSDDRNPYSYEQRKEMVEAVFKERVAVFALDDIGATSKRAWAEYVLKKITLEGLPKPDLYFAGSQEDSSWFYNLLEVVIVDRFTVGKKISATAIREGGMSDQIPPEVIKIIASFPKTRTKSV
ncbi:MAG: adenylyltransferase/cytidyltransferase family protein [Helicobacteraceae bacterium]|jgi:cytidyltransferase-like protein|nr:adenylyltransferase/cytidyltransferase family protein [Helicobacteraceae bacterium]